MSFFSKCSKKEPGLFSIRATETDQEFISDLPKNGAPVRLNVMKGNKPEFSSEVPLGLPMKMANGTSYTFVSPSLNRTLCPIDDHMSGGRVPVTIVITSLGRAQSVEVVFILKYDVKNSHIITTKDDEVTTVS